MQRPRLRIRTLMIVVAVAGGLLGSIVGGVRLKKRAGVYDQKAFYHHNQAQWASQGAAICRQQEVADRAAAKTDPDPWFVRRAQWASEQAAWYSQHAERCERLADRYVEAARRPWIVVPPDPPEPEQPPPPE